MDPSNILFNTLIMDPMNSGKNQFLVNLLCGPFCDKFDYIMLICLIG